MSIKDNINQLVSIIHKNNKDVGIWTDLKTGEDLTSENGQEPKRSITEILCLIHSEVSEALEGYRKNLPDSHLPHRSMFEVELADTLIRILDAAGGLGLDLGGAAEEKINYNLQRSDHKLENRKLKNGKKM